MDKATGLPTARHYVYALFRETGVPFYIGKGVDSRWLFHEREAQKDTRSHKSAIIRGMHARGFEVIKIKLHEGLTEAVAHAYEVALIKAIGRGDNGPLVNRTDGGDGVSGLKFSPETLSRMSAAHRGKKMSPESVAKGVAARRGLVRPKQSPERIEKTASKLRGRVHSPERIETRAAKMRGRKMSREQRAQLTTLKTGKKATPDTCARQSLAHRNSAATARQITKLASINRGTIRSVAVRAKISAALTGRERLPEHSANISASKRGVPQSVAARIKRGASMRAYHARRRAAKLESEGITT